MGGENRDNWLLTDLETAIKEVKIHEYFLPVLHEMGINEEDIHKIMVDNPARALTFVKPSQS
jgi:predicted metal-dependent phosphotriesterase family hydrolase